MVTPMSEEIFDRRQLARWAIFLYFHALEGELVKLSYWLLAIPCKCGIELPGSISHGVSLQVLSSVYYGYSYVWGNFRSETTCQMSDFPLFSCRRGWTGQVELLSNLAQEKNILQTVSCRLGFHFSVKCDFWLARELRVTVQSTYIKCVPSNP